MRRHIIHLHIPAFSIAVERVARPELRTRPVAVAWGRTARASVLCVSFEARQEGVARGMPLGRAREVCPGLTVLSPDPGRIEKAGRLLTEVAARYTPIWEPPRPGHVYLDVTGTSRLWGRARDTADRVRREVLARLGLAGTAGVAGNKMVSSIASRIHPVPGILDVDLGREQVFMAPLDVDVLPGIGPVRRRLLLEELGITRVRQVAGLEAGDLRLLFGRHGEVIRRRALGIDPTPVYPPLKKPVVMEEKVLSEDDNDDRRLLGFLYEMVEQCARRLRDRGLAPRKAGLLIRYADGREAGIRPVVGSELAAGPHRAVLLVRDENGYANLCRLISARHCDPEFDLRAALRTQRRGLIVISDDTEVLKALRKDGTEDLFVEVSPGYGMARSIAFSRRSGIPPAATNRTCLLDRDQFPLHRVLRAVALNTKLSRLTPADTAREHNTLCSPRDMINRFPHAPQAIRNTLRVVERCRTDWPMGRLVFPRFERMGDGEAFELLRRLTLEGCRRRYGRITRAVRERVAHEMGIIREKNFAHYFLVVADITRRAPRSCGRGSAAASIVAYALGITHVDPIRHNLFFERFLNPDRKDPPDIDVDFAWDEREQVLDYVFARYGHGRAAMVANHNTYGARSAVREVAKVFGLPDEEIGRFTGKIGFGWRLREVWEDLAAHPRMRGLRFDPPWDEILATAVRLEDHLNHLSVHCGGVVIVPDEVRRYCPVEISAAGFQVLQWEKEAVEEAGLVKIDLLGNRSLAVIRDALAMVERNTGRRIDYAGWDPVDDPETLKVFYRGETMGVFYFESPATRQVLIKVASGFTLEEYFRRDPFLLNVVVTSIIRPASNRSIRDWVTRLHGAPWDVPHPRLRPVLQETLGVMVFQEQLSRAAIHLAGFDPAEADTLRKVVSKKHREKKLRDFNERFLRGAEENGVPPEVARDTWDMMMGFDGYSFCKPHSASYTLVAYKSAWLRAHYPAEFMAAVVSNGGGYYSAFGYLSEARRMGLKLLSPDVNRSEIAYTGKGRAVRVGFMQLRDLRREAGEALIRERERNGPFASFASFLDRTRPHVRLRDARVLVRAGCFDRIEGSGRRPALLWQALRFFDRDETQFQTRLFGPGPSRRSECPHRAFRSLDLQTRIRYEVETLGFPLSVHPLRRYGNILERTPRCPAKDLPSRVGRTVTLVGWPVTGKTVHSRRGDPMKFVSFEDETGLYETVFFPREYRRFCHMLGKSRAYVLRGRVEEDLKAITVTVGWIEFLGRRAPAVKRTLPLPEALPGPPG